MLTTAVTTVITTEATTTEEDADREITTEVEDEETITTEEEILCTEVEDIITTTEASTKQPKVSYWVIIIYSQLLGFQLKVPSKYNIFAFIYYIRNQCEYFVSINNYMRLVCLSATL